MLRKFLLPGAIVLLAAGLIGLLYVSKPAAQKRAQRSEPLVKIAVQKITYASHNIMLPSQGLITAKTEAVLSAQVSGVITEISERVREQGNFNKGDSLIRLDDRDYQTALELINAQLRESEVALQQEQARSDQAARDWQRLNKQKKPNDLVLRKPQLMAAQARLSAVVAQVAQAQLNLERTRIRAPFSGASAKLHVGLGQYVTPGTALAEVVSTQALEVALPISAQWRHLLPEQGNKSEVMLTSERGEAVSAQLIRQSAMIDASNRQLRLVVGISPSDAGSRLIAGDFVSAKIQGKALDKVAILPVQALVNGNSVWQVIDGRLQKKQVNIVWKDGQQVYIDSGVEQGDMVNVTALAHVVSGTRVELLGDTTIQGPADKVEQIP